MNFLDSFGESEDIVQDLFVKFWEKYKDKQFEGSLRAYFFTAVRHNCAKVLKLKNRYNLQLEEEYIDEPVYSEEEFEGECRKLYAEIARLPEQCRKVFELIVLKDMKYKEVADFLGLSVNTVKTHFARALKQLRSSLQILLVFLRRPFHCRKNPVPRRVSSPAAALVRSPHFPQAAGSPGSDRTIFSYNTIII